MPLDILENVHGKNGEIFWDTIGWAFRRIMHWDKREKSFAFFTTLFHLPENYLKVFPLFAHSQSRTMERNSLHPKPLFI